MNASEFKEQIDKLVDYARCRIENSVLGTLFWNVLTALQSFAQYIKDNPVETSGLVPKTTKVNGHTLDGDIDITKEDIDLGNVPNVNTTDASNLTSGFLSNDRLASTVARTNRTNVFSEPQFINSSGGLTISNPTMNGAFGFKALNIEGTSGQSGASGGIAFRNATPAGATPLSFANNAGTYFQMWGGGTTNTTSPDSMLFQFVKGNADVAIYEANKLFRISSGTPNAGAVYFTVNPVNGNVNAGAVKISNGGYTTATDNATTPIPVEGVGTIAYANNQLLVWTGTKWEQLNKAQAPVVGKEDVANKSNDINLGNSTILYPTQNAVFTYVNSIATQLRGETQENIVEITQLVDQKEDLSNKSNDTALGTSTSLYPTQNAVKTYVDDELTLVFDVLDDVESVSNKSNDPNLGTSTFLYPTQAAVKAYVDQEIAEVVAGEAQIPEPTFSNQVFAI